MENTVGHPFVDSASGGSPTKKTFKLLVLTFNLFWKGAFTMFPKKTVSFVDFVSNEWAWDGFVVKT